MPKFLVPPDQFKEETAWIKGQDARHILRVLRLKPGDTLTLTDGEGMDYDARICRAENRTLTLKITACHRSKTESPLRLTVCCAMLKDKKMDRVIKHLIPLGIQQWVPFFCERAIPTPDAGRLQKRMVRWQAIAAASLKQCGRSCLVTLPSPLPFHQVLESSHGCHHKIIFWEKATTRLTGLAPVPGENSAIMLIGPEGGFTEKEIDMAREKGFQSFSIGPRILRAETAAIAATALVQHILGDI